MQVAILSPYAEQISAVIEATGDEWETFDKIEEVGDADFVVSYGHRFLIKEEYIRRFGDRLINLHISYLPWNRGADPNFWSFIDQTPKGVSIHVVDRGLDTGPIIAQKEVDLTGTLATSYSQLRRAMVDLFGKTWPRYRNGGITPQAQKGDGTYHRSADKKELWDRLPLGHNTRIECIQKLNAG